VLTNGEHMIDYSILAKAQSFYADCGFKYIEVPWLVSKEIDDITKPPGVLAYNVIKGDKEKRFIGSGEQGFLYLVSKGHLPSNSYFQTTTPCIRNDNFDQTHSKYFMKNELIYISREGIELKGILDEMIDDAERFFQMHTGKVPLDIVQTSEGYDINYKGVEIGSYGIRSCIMCDWVYGTGVAEPRFSRMLNAK